ncbi:3'-5' exonuclease [Ralstonia soli]|uniref:Exonuclease domain-containing protein n=1 Tax=Ralstonia soli TaxID=2953896 RepID=A0ABT1APP7_9RALS|nr:3'-5' exonuclease [Ralstonia soli]MCO5400209.1 exonuclease domain-containing protein [Ralstonia soli]
MILIVDLEATCSDDGSIPEEEMEIVEIGACWVDRRGHIFDEFQSFVRPNRHPHLTPFCAALTGINQSDIDGAEDFPRAAARLQSFSCRFSQPDAVWGSWGAYDRKQIERESAQHGLRMPITLPHQNLKRLFAKRRRTGKEVGMAMALNLVGCKAEGNHHRALDDARNIARLVPWVYGVET